jgi:hypothetical protein
VQRHGHSLRLCDEPFFVSPRSDFERPDGGIIHGQHQLIRRENLPDIKKAAPKCFAYVETSTNAKSKLAKKVILGHGPLDSYVL